MEIENNIVEKEDYSENYKNREDFLINLKKNIENLSIKDQTYILEMMINENINISENNNGSFINISSLKDDFLFKINNYVEIKMKQTELFNKVEDEKEEIKKKYMN
tara:strand:- start:12 stop:329 length:318 start_codon:yes stop_codon:yes gene_type:complete